MRILPEAVDLEDRVAHRLDRDPVDRRHDLPQPLELGVFVEVDLEVAHGELARDAQLRDVADVRADFAERLRQLAQMARLIADQRAQDADFLGTASHGTPTPNGGLVQGEGVRSRK